MRFFLAISECFSCFERRLTQHGLEFTHSTYLMHRLFIIEDQTAIREMLEFAARHGITVLNSPSTIDADYRGEIKVALINHGKESFSVELGDRIAQGVISLAVRCRDLEVKNVEKNMSFKKLGFIVCTVLILLYLFFNWRMIKIHRNLNKVLKEK